jgi:spore coat protein JB
MFLDTHPNDTEALAKREMYRKKLEMLIKEYENEYGPLTLSADFGNDGFDWVNDPWPWEKEAN